MKSPKMTLLMKSNFARFCVAALLGLPSAVSAQQQTVSPPGAILLNVLYGAAYYNEYMPADLQPGRLEKDVALMPPLVTEFYAQSTRLYFRRCLEEIFRLVRSSRMFRHASSHVLRKRN